MSFPVRVFLIIAVVVGLWPQAARAVDRVIGPEMGPVVSDMFRFPCDWEVESIAIRKGHVTAKARLPDGSACEVRLVHPDKAGPPDWTRFEAGVLAVLAAPACGTRCPEMLAGRIRGKADVFHWKSNAGPAEGGSAPSAGASILVTALVGLLAMGLLLWMGFHLVRGLIRLPGGATAAWVLLAGAAVLAARAWLAPFQSGDEIINFTSSLTGVFSMFDLVEYPHPTLYFNLSTALYGLFTLAVSVLTDISLAEAGIQAVLFHHVDLLLISRVLSLLFWVGLMGTVYAIVVRFTRERWTPLLAMVLVFPADLSYSTSFSPYSLGIFGGFFLLYWTVFRDHEGPGTRGRFITSGLIAGAALSAHYLALLFFPAFLVFLFTRPERRWLAPLMWFTVACTAVFLVVNFRVFLDFSDFLESWAWRVGEITTPDITDMDREARSSTAGSPLFYLRLLAWTPEAIMALLGVVAGAVRLVRKPEAGWGVMVVLPLYLLAVLSAPATRFEQYLMFVAPALAILGACGVWEVLGWVRAGRLRPWLVVLATALLLVPVVPRLGTGSMDPVNSLRSGDPVSSFTRWLSSVPSVAHGVGVTCPYAPHMVRAVQEGRMSSSIAVGLTDLLRRTTGRSVSWVNAGGSTPDGGTGLESLDWFYTVDWVRLPVTDPNAIKGNAPLRFETRESRVQSELVHTVYRVLRGPTDPAASTAAPREKTKDGK